jgi:hypothetical protein
MAEESSQVLALSQDIVGGRASVLEIRGFDAALDVLVVTTYTAQMVLGAVLVQL